MADRARHDPFAPARPGSRPRRSTAEETLPDWLFEALRSRDVPDEATEPLRRQFDAMSRAERAGALAELQSFRNNKAEMDGLAAALIECHAAADDDETSGGGVEGHEDVDPAAVALQKWHDGLTDADLVEAVDALDEIAGWLDEQDDRDAAYDEISALVGDGPHKVAEYDAAIAAGWSHDDAVDLTWPAEQYTPDRVTEIRETIAARDGDVPDAPLPTDDDGRVDVDVPRNATEVVSWIDEGAEGAVERAERALTVELGYPSVRKTVRAALNAVLGDERVREAIDGRG